MVLTGVEARSEPESTGDRDAKRWEEPPGSMPAFSSGLLEDQ